MAPHECSRAGLPPRGDIEDGVRGLLGDSDSRRKELLFGSAPSLSLSPTPVSLRRKLVDESLCVMHCRLRALNSMQHVFECKETLVVQCPDRLCLRHVRSLLLSVVRASARSELRCNDRAAARKKRCYDVCTV
jgi:hypothetical protein